MQDGLVPLFALDNEGDFANSPGEASPSPVPAVSGQIRQQMEVEAKFTVPDGVTLPDLGQVARLGPAVDSELHALYFDTPDLSLMRHGVALRRRSGGSDAGWHLKVKTGNPQERREIHAPIVGARPPLALREALPESLRDAPLLSVARLITKRREIPLLARNGTLLATVCSDEVEVELSPLDSSARRGPSRSWKEVEVELAKGDQRVLIHLSRVLRAAGFESAPYGSKISRALKHWPEADVLGRAQEAVMRYAWKQIGIIQFCEGEVAGGCEAAVHDSRVAARRLRSTLSTFPALFPGTLARHLVAELRWYGLVLSTVRDVQVLRQRLGGHSAGEDEASRQFDGLLIGAESAAVTQAHADLHSPRYELLHDSMTELIDPLNLDAGKTGPVTDAVVFAALSAPYAKTVRRVRRVTARSNDADRPPRPKDLAAWHRVRKAAKAVRYGYEALVGEEAPVTEAWKSVTSSLGELQDHVVAADKVRLLLDDRAVTDTRLRHRLEHIRADEESAIAESAAAAPAALVTALGRSLAREHFLNAEDEGKA